MSIRIYNIDATRPHIYHREVTERNGNDMLVMTWEIDESKPRVWLDGFTYRFNSELIGIQRIPTKMR